MFNKLRKQAAAPKETPPVTLQTTQISSIDGTDIPELSVSVESLSVAVENLAPTPKVTIELFSSSLGSFSLEDANETPNTKIPVRLGGKHVFLPPVTADGVFELFEIKKENAKSDYALFINRAITGTPAALLASRDLIRVLETMSSEQTINMFISSPGGCLATTLPICAAMGVCKGTINTVAVGQTASAAALIWSVGHNRYVENGGFLMFHMSSHGDFGNSHFIAESAVHTRDSVIEFAIKPLLNDNLITSNEYQAIIDRKDVFISAAEMNARLQALTPKVAPVVGEM